MQERLIEILRIALRYRVNDIYFELKENHGMETMSVQMKINGRIETLKPKEKDTGLFTYIAYQARLDMSDASLPQSGAFDEIVDGRKVSLRYGIVISIHMKKGVLRILNQNGHLSMSDLTQDKNTLKWMNGILNRTEGLYPMKSV